VLPELPKEGTTRITWDNGDTGLNEAENELHRRATQILQYHINELQAAEERETPLVNRYQQTTRHL
jgi:uncharacterized protein involved in exopolysaccharide biosynthesis